MSFTSEVELNNLEVRDPDGRLGDSLLVVVVPLAAQPLGLVPHLDEVLVILNHDVVLVKLAVHVGLGPALQVDRDLLFTIQHSGHGTDYLYPSKNISGLHTKKLRLMFPGAKMGEKLSGHLVIHDVERIGPGSGLGLDIDAVVLVDGALAEDDPVEGPVEADLHLHVGLAAHDLKTGDVGHVRRSLHIPEFQVILTEDSGKQ